MSEKKLKKQLCLRPLQDVSTLEAPMPTPSVEKEPTAPPTNLPAPAQNLAEAQDSSGSDVDQLFSLKAGDIIEMGGCMLGILDEPLVGEITAVSDSRVSVRFTYCGVWVRNSNLTKNTEGVSSWD